jgi:putative tricarboxylic transport membrane protein
MGNSAKLKKVNQEMIVSVFLLAYFLMITLFAFDYPEEARLFPLALGIPATILCVLVLFAAHRKFRAAHAGAESKTVQKAKGEGEGKTCSASFEIKRELVAFGFALLYLLLVYLVGFLIATFLLGLFIPYFLGMRRALPIVIFTVALVVIVWLVFPLALGLSLPTGLLGLI